MSSNQPASLFILCGPSCAGKDTLINRLLDARPELAKVTTTTTRPPREGEVAGVSYHFLTPEDFVAGRDKGAFLETAEVHGNYYGTSKQAVLDVFDKGKMPVCILDVQGVQTVQGLNPVAVVFITAPLETIEKRIIASRPGAEVGPRMASVRREVEIGLTFEKVLTNEEGQLETAVQDLINYYDQAVTPRLLAYKQGLGTQAQKADSAGKNEKSRPRR